MIKLQTIYTIQNEVEYQKERKTLFPKIPFKKRSRKWNSAGVCIVTIRNIKAQFAAAIDMDESAKYNMLQS